VATALANQKARYEDRLKEVKELFTKQAKQKMTEMREVFVRKTEAQEARLKSLKEENRGLVERLSSVDQRIEQIESVSRQEIQVFR
jgi:hypothetical protein